MTHTRDWTAALALGIAVCVPFHTFAQADTSDTRDLEKRAAAKLAQMDLSADNAADWRALIATTAAETAWERIPWLASFHAGVRSAAEQEKPLLLWVMNGHPLGCT